MRAVPRHTASGASGVSSQGSHSRCEKYRRKKVQETVRLSGRKYLEHGSRLAHGRRHALGVRGKEKLSDLELGSGACSFFLFLFFLIHAGRTNLDRIKAGV